MTKLILIIEDDADTAASLADILSDEGYTCQIARNGYHALELLDTAGELPALILLDLNLPGLDAYGFRSTQEMDNRLAGIPIVIISAEAEIESKALRAGIRDYLRKPVDAGELLQAVRRLSR